MSEFCVFGIKDSLSSSILPESLFIKENVSIAKRYFKTILSSAKDESIVKDLVLVKFNSFSLNDYEVIDLEA